MPSPAPILLPRFPGLLQPFALASLALALAIAPLRAVLLYDTADPNANITAPTGIYADSGWGYMGFYGAFMGTMISPQHFITAQHFGTQGGTFVSKAVFNGSADVTYTIDAAANGGIGFWDIAGTDLRILKINETFTGYAPLYTGSSEVGLTMVVFGRGGPRGAAVVEGDFKGWLHTTADGVARWGANEVSATLSSPAGPLLAAEFNALPGQQEASLSVGDSGGAVFVFAGGQWLLAGVNYGVEGLFDTNNTIGDASEFSAALIDTGGLWVGSDGGGWTFINDVAQDLPSHLYASRISSSAGAIQSITGIPEPGAGVLMAVAAVFGSLRRRRNGPGSHAA